MKVVLTGYLSVDSPSEELGSVQVMDVYVVALNPMRTDCKYYFILIFFRSNHKAY